ncbi:Response regulator receiver domain-containing protein [Devosia crocina]|uniref:Response regulator receiver domain-containing protein n=1 Tax=Devosia crocina TaxID=429728 RepID=A0A1I7NC85_9HYPH|nr:response regulator [Devosia crocina]SFV32295.1 Response regulator receiver domain-containing protein [Devosia crocina]
MAIIVIAEDEYLLATMLEAILEDENHEVRMAPHGVAALKLVRAHKPDLLITDFMMPLMTGLELAQAVREDPEISAIPILLVSGAQGSIGRAHPEAFDAVLDKPYDPARLVAAVNELLSD